MIAYVYRFWLGLAWVLLSFSPGQADMAPTFGPKPFVRRSGPPQTFVETFRNCETAAHYRLVAVNGKANGSDRVSSASVSLNGEEILGPGDFSQKVAQIEKPVSLLLENQLQIRLTSKPGSMLTVRVECTANCLDVQISSPLPGTTGETPVLVQGTVEGSDTLGVSLNGTRAEVHEQHFAAVLAVAEETTQLTATATNACGQAANHIIPVALQPSQPLVSMIASPRSGLAPLPVDFGLSATLAQPVETISWDYDGDGITDAAGAGLTEAVNTYSTPGLYMPTVTVRDVDGNEMSAFVVIHVRSEAMLTEHLQGRWDALLEALGRNEMSHALSLIDPEKRLTYQDLFVAAGGNLPDLAQQLGGALEFQDLRGPRAFFLLRDSFGDERAVVFRLDHDGLWKVRFF